MADPSDEAAEAAALLKAFQELGVVPKAGNAADLKQWVLEYADQQHQEDVSPPVHKVKQEMDQSMVAAAEELASHINTTRRRLSIFSGDPPLSKGDVTYDQWSYEVRCHMEDQKHSNASLCEAIRLSLKGEPKSVLMRLGSKASLEDILSKLKFVYDRMESVETLLGSFYSARQRDGETVSSWGLRLEDILSKASEKGVVPIQAERRDAMLRSVFYERLRPALKDVSGHKFDTIKEFDALRQAVRRIEFSRGMDHTKEAHVKMLSSETKPPPNPEIEDLKEMIKQLSSRFDTLQKDKQAKKKENRRDNQARPHQNATQHYTANQPREEPKCYRCGQYGHLQLGCRVIMDHSRNHLNGQRPMDQGYP